jgi:hypothetical protein
VKLGMVACAVLLLSLVAGIGLNAEYFTAVLPAHAASEIANTGYRALFTHPQPRKRSFRYVDDVELSGPVERESVRA